nr:NAD-dependent epimerase/dehydratase family protein [uncultured Psychroserpens sp.]
MAKTFSNYSNNNSVVIFASGVSNSIETKASSFKREFQLLKETIVQFPDATLVYFSTCSIEDPTVADRSYVKHKLLLENYIQTQVKKYLIFRISNVVGLQGNDNTIMNYLVNSVKNNKEIPIWKNAERNLIDADDVKYIIDEVLIRKHFVNQTINVATRESLLVKDILAQIEKHLRVKAQVKIIDRGNSLAINTNAISKSLDEIESLKGTGLQYIYNLLEKYY